MKNEFDLEKGWTLTLNRVRKIDYRSITEVENQGEEKKKSFNQKEIEKETEVDYTTNVSRSILES